MSVPAKTAAPTFGARGLIQGWFLLRRWRLVLFWNLLAYSPWGYRGPVPALPFDWRFYAGPLCLARVTENRPRRLSRQVRRQIERQIAKRLR